MSETTQNDNKSTENANNQKEIRIEKGFLTLQDVIVELTEIIIKTFHSNFDYIEASLPDADEELLDAVLATTQLGADNYCECINIGVERDGTELKAYDLDEHDVDVMTTEDALALGAENEHMDMDAEIVREIL